MSRAKSGRENLGHAKSGRGAEVRRARPLLGTFVEIAARGNSAMETNAAVDTAFGKIARIEKLMSYHDPASELSRINREAYDDWVWLAQETADVLRASQTLSAESNGLFDPTVATTLTRLGYLPRHADAPHASGQGDWRNIVVEGRRVRFTRRIRIDLSGIAKGYAVDQALGVLKQAGMTRAKVNAGGDLAVFAPEPEPVHLRHPRHPGVMIEALHLREGAVATSAGYFQSLRHEGRWVTPLIDPRTRQSLCLTDSVSVVARDCTTADALTKIVAADPAGAPARLARLGAQAIRLQPERDDLRLCHTGPAHASWQCQRLAGEIAA